MNNFNGIGGIQTPRGSGKYGPYLLQNFNVHHNTVTMTVGHTGIVQYGNLFNVYTSQNNRFADNTYYLGPKPRTSPGRSPLWMRTGGGASETT